MEMGITRWCEWRRADACTVGWGGADNYGVYSCREGSARANCRRWFGIPLSAFDTKSVQKLRHLDDIEETE